VELEIISSIYVGLTSVYSNHISLSTAVCDFLTFPYWVKMLKLLSPWSTHLDLNCTSHIDSIDKDGINDILMLFSQAERNMGLIYTHRSHFDLAQSHCQRAISYARLYEGEEEDKAGMLIEALRIYYELTTDQNNYDGALIFAKESYDFAAITYDPAHSELQTAAGLIHKGDHDDAETFAQLTLESLKDPANKLDQESEAVAKGYFDLGNVINQLKTDFVKAEMLVRESLRIRTRLFHSNHIYIGINADLLAIIRQPKSIILSA
jgi:tetratricopeptide (TPR) repeat protein